MFFFSFRGPFGESPQHRWYRPEEILEPPVSSDALRPAWLVGFDGAVWDGAKMDAWSCPGVPERGIIQKRTWDG